MTSPSIFAVVVAVAMPIGRQSMAINYGWIGERQTAKIMGISIDELADFGRGTRIDCAAWASQTICG